MAQVTILGIGGGIWNKLGGDYSNKVPGEIAAGGIYNAGAFFTSGQNDVVIALYDPLTGNSISLDSVVCVEVPNKGLYLWDLSKITTLPTPRKEYGFVMTDGSTSEGGIIVYDDFLIQYIIHENMDI